MKKIILFIFASLIFFSANSLAGVTFIVDSPQHSSRFDQPSQPSSSEKCIQAGYNKDSCPDGSYANMKCPYNLSYFKYCCPKQFENDYSKCD